MTRKDLTRPRARIPDDACRSPIELMNRVVVCDGQHEHGGLTQGFDNAEYHQAHGGHGAGEVEWHLYWKQG